MSHFSTAILSRVAPADLTIADCVEGRFSVTVWCESRCGGRPVDLARLDRVAGRKLLDLMREGAFSCMRCGGFAEAVTVSSTEMADRVLYWRVGDDSGLPSGAAPRKAR